MQGIFAAASGASPLGGSGTEILQVQWSTTRVDQGIDMTAFAVDLLDQLRAERDLVAVIPFPDADSSSAAARAASWLGVDVVSLASEAFSSDGFDVSWSAPADAVLIDIDLLFSPSLKVEPLSQLRLIGRSVALVAIWPGRVEGGRLTYSEPGRNDRYDVPAKHVLVLDSVETYFPDEDPYRAEYYPA